MSLVRAALVALALSGCTFEVDGIDVAFDAAAGDAAAQDLSPAVDLLRRPDLSTFCDPAGADNHCASDGQSVLSCRADGSAFDEAACSFGCGTQGGAAHCLALEPGGVVQASDYGSATATPTITSDVLINTDDGSISGGLTRAAGNGLVGGIWYRQATGTAKVGVFGFASLTVASGVVVRARGAGALAIVASKQVMVAGTLDLQDDCANGLRSAGAGAGGVLAATMGGGAGGGGGGGMMPGPMMSMRSSGGGGGGYGDVGGHGGMTMLPGGTAGALFGDLLLEPIVLVGGSGGGAGGAGGGGGGGPAPGGNGGSGGGAVQIAVNGALTITGTIQAGGCGGRGGMGGSGGGGGAGGAILLEAATMMLGGSSALVANGGGGGGTGGGSPNGGNGSVSAVAAPGGSAGNGGGAGAAGGVTGSLAGHDAASVSDKPSGGGGGAVGRIALKTLDGTVQNQGALLSPAIADQSSVGKSVTTLSTAAFE